MIKNRLMLMGAGPLIAVGRRCMAYVQPCGCAVGIRANAGLRIFAFAFLAGCASVHQPASGSGFSSQYFHEKLSELISRDGFPHKIISERSDHANLDSIHIRFPTDSVKRRHEGLEKLLVDIARMCSLPEYSQMPVRIVVNAVEGSDGSYIRRVLETSIAKDANMSVAVSLGTIDGMVISVRHRSRVTER